MPSVLAWLDQSADQQRRVRELVRLFSTTESRDELGLGQIRDVYANRLFPGTSVIQTRARYLLFVPWLFQMHESRGRSGSDLLRRVQASERRLIEDIKVGGAPAEGPVDIEGLIGGRAGTGVKILPSAIYWGGLTRYGVLTRPLAPDELGGVVPVDMLDPDASDERAGRAQSNWKATIPLPPVGFPESIAGGFALRPAEGEWLRDTILEAASATLLAHLVAASDPPLPATGGPWDEPVAWIADPEILRVLEDARVFSLVFHGAALLYNLLLARAYETAGLNRVTGKVVRYEDELERWAAEIEADRDAVQGWDLDSWWAELHTYNQRIGLSTQSFVNDWVGFVRSGPADRLVTDAGAAALVAHRERVQKKAQARLVNERLLRNWNGASGADRLVFRWPTVRRLVSDIVESVEAVDAAP